MSSKLERQAGARNPQAGAKSGQADEHERKPCKPCSKSTQPERRQTIGTINTNKPSAEDPHLERDHKQMTRGTGQWGEHTTTIDNV
jgi:hypothetical protein